MSLITPPPGESAPRHRVLVVDDQALIGTMVQRMLADLPDAEVQFRRDAAAAIEAAATLRPTVILQDLVMPDVEGADMIQRFRALPATAHVPIIMLSAVEEPAVKAELLAGGAADYLVKLPDPVELQARVRLHSEAHARLLERNAAFAALETANAELARERERSERLLHAVLPGAIAERLKAGPRVIADLHPAVTVLFADMCGFTELTSSADPQDVVALLDEMFGCFDELARRRGIEKIKTIGDAWMAASGLPEPRADHAVAMADLALELVAGFEALAARRRTPAALRVGMHAGPVVAGVIGRDRYAYDLWGDTVNLASRMESHGEPGRVHLTATTASLLGDAFEIAERGEIVVKGKGSVRTAFLIGRRRPG